MRSTAEQEELLNPRTAEESANGAPAGEPEVWDERIPAFSPLLGRSAQPPLMMVSPAWAARASQDDFSLNGFLREERAKDLLRFSTAGSVDDGKSTLIGRLLYDTQSVYDDQVSSIAGKGTTAAGVLDLALLTDGLRAEREQGITIDVAYRYFSTARRKFIIADTPGHEQYTRNMATGASTASLAIVLVDARKGVLVQSRRHACIAALLGVRHIVVAVNKMDLVGYTEGAFDAIRAEFTAFFGQLGELRPPHVDFVPVSALAGDNVVQRTAAMPWYAGPSLLDLLESVSAAETQSAMPFRLAVQRVLRPAQDFRGFAGQIASGSIHPGDAVMVMSSRRASRVERIVTYAGDLAEAYAPMSVTVTLQDEIDVSRGDLLVSLDAPATVTDRLTASLVWMGEQPLDPSRRYLLKHTSRTVQASVTAVRYRLNVDTLEQEAVERLELNEIGLVEMQTVQALAVDLYAENHTTGSFVLIDMQSNATVAAGMLREAGAARIRAAAESVTPEERSVRWGHNGKHINVTGPVAFADAAERALFLRQAVVLRLGTPSADTLEAVAGAGALALTHTASMETAISIDGKRFAATTIDEMLSILETQGVLKRGLKL